MKSFQKYQYYAAFFCLAITLILWLAEAWLLPKKSHSDELAESSYLFENIAHYIHYFTGYKIVFPAIGLLIILILAYFLRPLLTKNEERP